MIRNRESVDSVARLGETRLGLVSQQLNKLLSRIIVSLFRHFSFNCFVLIDFIGAHPKANMISIG